MEAQNVEALGGQANDIVPVGTVDLSCIDCLGCDDGYFECVDHLGCDDGYFEAVDSDTIPLYPIAPLDAPSFRPRDSDPWSFMDPWKRYGPKSPSTPPLVLSPT